jgi:short-subunit dehydrogenase/acyl dehydratase
MTFEQFQIGDYAVFERTFTAGDIAGFSQLSGDKNPLHHDTDYAAKHAVAGSPIVPLHMTLAPLSMIAGMIFPGEPSLYLGHDVQANKPVMYGERLRYSARVEAINRSHRILTLRVLVLREAEVVVDARMRVQARLEQWETGPSALIRRASPGTAVITGSNGEIGSSVAVALAKAGWRLVLLDRGPDPRRRQLEETLSRVGADRQFLAADLAQAADRSRLSDALRGIEDPGLIVHAASPGVDAATGDLVDVNFTALKDITAALLPGMLARQVAAMVLIGTTAVRAAIPGWEGYAGAKAMAMNLIDSIDRRYAPCGVRGYTIMPGFVATRFSQNYRTSTDAALLPGEVSEALLSLLADRDSADNVLILEAGRTTRGRYGFSRSGASPVPDGAPAPPAAASSPRAVPSDVAKPSDGISPTVRKALKLPAAHDLHGGGLGLTAGWDSLKHIEIILAIESQHNLHFKSSEIEATHRYDDLAALCVQKLRASAPGN